MTLAPLLAASPLIQLHAYLGMAAVVVGVVQVAAPKGTVPHRAFGWTWIVLIAVMMILAIIDHANRTSYFWDLFDTGVCSGDATSPVRATSCASIHLISIYFILALPFGALAARRGEIALHRYSMLWLFWGIFMTGTMLTAVPHRIMHAVIFGS
jgi:uncharacterized membrane protein